MGISMILGGSEPLPGWFGAVMQWKLKLKWAFACVKEGVKACQDALCTHIIKGPSSKKCQKSPQKRAQKSKLLFWVAQKSILLKKMLKKVNSLFWVLKIVLFKVTFIKCCSNKGSKKLLSQKSTQKRAFMIEFPQKRALKSESLKKEN